MATLDELINKANNGTDIIRRKRGRPRKNGSSSGDSSSRNTAPNVNRTTAVGGTGHSGNAPGRTFGLGTNPNDNGNTVGTVSGSSEFGNNANGTERTNYSVVDNANGNFNIGGTGSDSSGNGSRSSGRTQSETQTKPILVDVPAKDAPKRGRKPKSETPTSDINLSVDMLNFAYQTAFTGIALATGHDFWQKTPEECQSVAELSKKCLDQLAKDNPELFKQVTTKLEPTMLVAHLSMLIMPSLAMEMNIRKHERYYGKTANTNTKTEQPNRNGTGPTIPDLSTLF